MKVIIHGDNVQMVLNAGEIERLFDGQRVEERLEIGPEPFVCTLEAAEDAPGMGASLQGGHFKVIVPRRQIEQWAGSDQTSLDTQQPTGPGPAIHLAVEKDMAGTLPPAKPHGDVLGQAVQSMDYHSSGGHPTSASS